MATEKAKSTSAKKPVAKKSSSTVVTAETVKPKLVLDEADSSADLSLEEDDEDLDENVEEGSDPELVVSTPEAQEDTSQTLSLSDAAWSAALEAGASVQGADEELVSSFDLPPVFDLAEQSTPGKNTFNILAFGTGCMECNAFVTDGDLDHTDLKCHFSRGNTFCPAQHAKIIFVGARRQALSKIQKAQHNKDTNRLLGLLQGLDKLSIEDKNFVLQQAGII